MSQTVSPSTSRSYGLARVSRAWSVSRAGVYRFLKGTPSPAIARRPGPTGPCPDADLADHIRREIEASDFHGEGYRKIWARLRVAGVRSSPRRVRRVMGENGLLAPHRTSMQRGPDCHSGLRPTAVLSASARSPRRQGSGKSARAATIFIHNGAPQALVGCYENRIAGENDMHDAHSAGVDAHSAGVRRSFSSIMARRRRWLAATKIE